MDNKWTKYVSILAFAGMLVFLFLLTNIQAQTDVFQETGQERDARMEWWRDARFGMFIHWGLYSIPAGEWKGRPVRGVGEWNMDRGQIPIEDYEPLKEQFNPAMFDADRWVRIAKEAGMKYIVITTKHHDGFCLFDSKYSDYDIMATPFKRDIMKELSDACRRHGLKMCWYHSILDWHHPDYLPRRGWETRTAEGADYDRYIDHMKNQLTELVTNYGEIGVLWFDGGWEHEAGMHRAEEIIAHLRNLQPSIIINDRIQLPQDFNTPEQEIPDTGIPGRDWETCMTMNNTWGFKKNDHNWKSTEDLLQKLADIASKGGNFLLNVGPTAIGEIPQPSIERLKEMGDWLKVNGEAVYGTSASPFEAPAWGRYTQKALTDNITRLYLHVFDWPNDEKLIVEGLSNEAKYAFFLSDADRRQLGMSRNGNLLVIHVPRRAPDAVNSVVVLDIVGKPGEK
ncbi:alpha-L-fucosidase [bacterium SM23_31]|nr:MAG: alpha-L-fucosidase [bacterium SM23_31]